LDDLKGKIEARFLAKDKDDHLLYQATWIIDNNIEKTDYPRDKKCIRSIFGNVERKT
jgi:hypothetical protein